LRRARYGQEINNDTWAMSKMNVFLHDMEAQRAQTSSGCPADS
jgi:type I restriction-modification system DNA methylase subunit